MDMMQENNQVRLCGTMAGAPHYSHSAGGQEFYAMPLEVRRLSGSSDVLNILLRREQLSQTEAAEHERLLASCYRECMALAAENGCESIAFCCISTGVFRFPARRAAEIAVETVLEALDRGNPVRQVVFNVFKDSDRAIYEALL